MVGRITLILGALLALLALVQSRAIVTNQYNGYATNLAIKSRSAYVESFLQGTKTNPGVTEAPNECAVTPAAFVHDRKGRLVPKDFSTACILLETYFAVEYDEPECDALHDKMLKGTRRTLEINLIPYIEKYGHTLPTNAVLLRMFKDNFPKLKWVLNEQWQ